MQLMKKTPLGTLMARYKQDSAYPGFTIDLFRKDEPHTPICMVEYEASHNCIQVIVYGDVDSDEPTVISKILLPCIIKREGGRTDEE